MEIALSEWADPNQRCAAITAALALLVCPDAVRVSECLHPHGVELTFQTMRLRLPLATEAKDFAWSRAVFSAGMQADAEAVFFSNLAETYGDHAKNISARAHLHEFLPLADDAHKKAAVLGIAWALLQNQEVAKSFRFSTEDGRGGFLSAPGIGVSFRWGSYERENAAAPGAPGVSAGIHSVHYPDF